MVIILEIILATIAFLNISCMSKQGNKKEPNQDHPVLRLGCTLLLAVLVARQIF